MIAPKEGEDAQSNFRLLLLFFPFQAEASDPDLSNELSVLEPE